MVGEEQDHRDQGKSAPSLSICARLRLGQNISHLQNLKILSLPSNRLSQISGLDHLSSLEDLYVSHNAIKHISGLEHCPKLKVLDISNNQIAELSNLEQLAQLEELWASSNRFSSFEEIETQLKDKEHLNTVYFEANPLQIQNAATYRNKIKLALPQLKQLDASK